MAADKSLGALAGGVNTIASNSPKIQKDVKDIRDAICGKDGIRDLIIKVSEGFQKNGALEALSKKDDSKNLEKSNGKLLKTTDNISKTLEKILKQIQKSGGKSFKDRIGKGDKVNLTQASNIKLTGKDKSEDSRLSGSISIMERLKGISMKDFKQSKRKLKLLNKIMMKAKDLFAKFKDKQEAEDVMKFTNESVEIVNTLAKSSKSIRKAKKTVKAMEALYFGRRGKGGLLALYIKISMFKKEIDAGTKGAAKMNKSCGALLLTSMALAGIAVFAIPATLGALAMKLLIHIMTGTFKVLALASRFIKKGSRALLLMSSSIITFSIGLGLMGKAVRNLKLKDIGLMILGIAGMGLAVAGLGFLSIPILFGSLALGVLGISLTMFALPMLLWANLDSASAMANISDAVNGLRDVFGLDLGKNDSGAPKSNQLKNGLFGLAMGLLEFGKTFFIMGSILLAGAALDMLYLGLKPWENYTGAKKAAKNMGDAITALKKTFGLDSRDGKSVDSKKVGAAGDFFGMASAIFQMGKVFAEMGAIVLATACMDIIRLTLIPWEKYTGATTAIGNMKTAIAALKDCFGLDDRKNESVKDQALGAGKDLIGLASAILQMGKVFVVMGTLVLATAMMDLIRLTLMPWENFNAESAVGNMTKAVSGLKSCFGLKDRENEGILGSIVGGISDLFSLGASLLQMGKTMVQMGTLLIACAAMDKIRENLIAWENYNPTKSLSNMTSAIDGLQNAFGLSAIEREEEDSGGGGFLGKLWNGAKKIVKGAVDVLSTPFKMIHGLAETGTALAEGGAKFAKLNNLVTGSTLMLTILQTIKPWDNYTGDSAFKNISNAITRINDIMFDGSLQYDSSKTFKKVAKNFGKSLKIIRRGIGDSKDLITLTKLWSEPKTAEPLNKAIESVNSLNLEKATVLRDIFTSFARIKYNRPFDKFTRAVERFEVACNNMVDSIKDLTVTSDNINNAAGDGSSTTTTTGIPSTGNMSIENANQLAEAIANALRTLTVRLDPNMLDINLLVEGMSGRSVKLSIQD